MSSYGRQDLDIKSLGASTSSQDLTNDELPHSKDKVLIQKRSPVLRIENEGK